MRIELDAGKRVDPRLRTREEALRRLARLGWLMDSSVRIPGTSRTFGLDAVMSVVPGIGSVGGAAVSGYLLLEAWRMDAPLPLLGRMARNVAVDAVLGAIPILGPVFDLVYKANQANVALLTDWLEGRS
jgi:hypothetical protein